MKGLFIPEITAEMFRNGCLESIEELMAEGEVYDIDYSPWIPVSERLPEERNLYLITFGKYDSVLDVHEAHYVDGEWLTLDHEYKFKTVRAWMPLPEPYREDGEA